MISISQRFTLVTKIMKKAWSILAMYRLGFYRILLSQIPVQNQTNYISFESSPHAERNGARHTFIPPITAVKKQKAPRKHPPKLLHCAVYQTGKVV